MNDKSPHPRCKLCGANHALGAPHAWEKPAGTKEQRMQIADAVLADKTKAAPKAKAKKPRDASAPKAKPVRAGDGLAGPASVVDAPPANIKPASKPRGRPKLVPDRRAYLAEKARERRARQKAEKSK